MADIKFKLEVEDGNFASGIEHAIDKINKLGDKMGSTKAELKKAFADLGKQSFQIGGDKAVEYFNNEVVKAATVVRDLETEMDKMRNADGFDKNSSEAKELSGDLNVAKQNLENLKAAYDGAQAEQLAQASQNAKGLSDALGVLPPSMNNAVSGFKKLITAAKAFIATPLGAIVAALAAVFGMLKSYLTGTAEGQQRLAKISATLSSVFASIKDVAAKLGKAIMDAFSNPKQAVSDLWNAIKSNLQTRLEGFIDQWKALGKVIKSVFTLDWDGVKEGAKDFGDAVVRMGTGKNIDEMTNLMSNFAKETANAAKQAAILADRELKLRQNRSKWQIQEAKLEEQISNARLAAYDEDSSKAEQAKALAQAQELIRKKYEKQIAFAREEYNIFEAQNALHENTIEDYEKEDTLLANITQLQAQMNSEMAGFERRRASLSKSAEQENLQRLQEEKTLAIDIEQTRLNMQDESLRKTLEQINLEKQRKKIELETQEQNWKQNQQGKLTEAQENYIKSMSGLIDEAATTAATQAIFDQYASAAAKAIKQNKEFDAEIEMLKSKGIDTTEAEKQRNDAALAYMQDVEGGLTPEFKLWIDSLDEYTTKTLESMLQGAEAELLALKAQGASNESIIQAEARIAALNKEVKQAQTDIQRGPKLTAYKNLNKILGSAAEGFAAMGETGKEAFDAIMKDVSSVIGTAQAVFSNIQTLVEGTIQAEVQGAEQGSEAVKAVEKASVILAIIGAVLSLAMKVANALKGEHDYLNAIRNEVEELRDSIRDLHREMALDISNNNTIFGENTYKNLQQYTKATQEYADEYQKAITTMAVSGIEARQKRFLAAGGKNVKSFFQPYFEAEKERALQGVKSVNDAVNLMLDSTSIQTRHSTWFRSEQRDTLRNLLGDVELVGNTEAETMENLRKFTESDLYNRLGKEQKSVIDNMIADWDTYQEALDGVKETFANFYSEMTNSFADSIKEGFTDGAKAGRQNFKEQVNGMVSDFYLQMRIGERTAELQDKYTQEMLDARTQGTNKQQSIALAYADELAKMYDEELAAYEALQSDLETRGYGLKDALDGTLSGAIAGASQESIDLLSGYCNAVRIQQVDGINIMREQLISLSGIEGNTRAINVGLQGFRTSMENILRADGNRGYGQMSA